MLNNEIRAEILSYMKRCGVACTVNDLIRAVPMDQDRVTPVAAKSKTYKILCQLEQEGYIESWLDPGRHTKHWRYVEPEGAR